MYPDERKAFLTMAERRARPGSGSAPPAVHEAPAAFGVPPLRRWLGDVPFVVVGGLATRRYMPARMTLDADVLVQPSDLPRAERALADAGARRTGPLAIGGSTWTVADGHPIDLIALEAPWTAAAIAAPAAAPDGLPYVDLPYLVLMKLAASRPQDLADISRMLGLAADDALGRTRALVARYQPQDADDLESLIRLGRLEHDRTAPGP